MQIEDEVVKLSNDDGLALNLAMVCHRFEG